MIIEKLKKLDAPRRKAVMVFAVLAAVCICYYTITRGSVASLQAAGEERAVVQAAYSSTGNLQEDYAILKTKLEDGKRKLQKCQQQCFNREDALKFFENINSMALTHNLQPISRTISEPKDLVNKKDDNEKDEQQLQFIKTQSANITLSGNYFDIVNFVNELTQCPQKLSITDLRIALPAGKRFNPEVSFKVALLVDLSQEIEK